MSFPTLQKGVERLIKLGILAEMTGQRRHRLYVAHELLHILSLGTDRTNGEAV